MSRLSFLHNPMLRWALVFSLAVLVAGGWSWRPSSNQPEEAVVLAQEDSPEPAPPPEQVAPPEAGIAPVTEAMRVIGRIPFEGEVLQDQITFFFNQPLGELPQNEPAMTVEPYLAGNLESGPNYIRYIRPPITLPQGVFSFNVRLSPELKGADGAKLSPEDLEFEVITQRLDVASVELSAHEDACYKLRFRFNALMNWEELKPLLSLLDAKGQRLQAELQVEEHGLSAVLSIPDNSDFPVTFVIARGAPARKPPLRMETEYRLTFPRTPPLKVDGAEWRTDPYSGEEIILRFSKEVQLQSVGERVRLVNVDSGQEIPFRLDESGLNKIAVLRVGQRLPDLSQIALSMDKGIQGAELDLMLSPYQVTIQKSLGPLNIVYGDWHHRGVEGPVLSLEFSNAVDLSELESRLSIEPSPGNIRLAPGYYRNIQVFGEWKAKQRYQLQIAPGLTDSIQSQTNKQVITFRTPPCPEVSGVDIGYPGKLYFPRRSGGQITIDALNTTSDTVVLSQLFPSNIVYALDLMQNGLADQRFSEKMTREIASKTLHFPVTPDTRVSAGLDLNELLPKDLRGVFTLSMKSNPNWRNVRIVLWTDIGLVAQWNDAELTLFAHQLFSLEPLSGAKISIYSNKGQLLGQLNTDAQGQAVFKAFDTALGAPKLAVAETFDDYSFLELTPRTEDPVAYRDDMPLYDAEAYDVYIYADRNLYRPGETMHLRWIARKQNGEVLAGVPLEFRLINPQQRAIQTTPVTLSDLGTGGLDIATKADFLTGAYTLQLRVPGAETALNEITVNIEDFVPNRIKAKVATDPGPWRTGTEYNVHVTAEHLFGAPASGLKAKASVILQRGEFKSEAWPGLRFTNDSAYTAEVRSLGEEVTDDAGNAAFKFKYPAGSKISFPVRATSRAEIAEPGGRAVTGLSETLLLPSEILLGIAATAKPDARTLDISVAAVNADETPAVLTSVKVSLEREDWHYYVRRFEGNNKPEWSRSFSAIQTVDVPLEKGRGVFSFDMPRWGYHRVRVHSPETPQFSSLSFYAYYNRVEFVDEARPSLIKLATDKKEYLSGEEIELRIESPFDGRAFIVLQGETLHKSYVTRVENGLAVLRFLAEGAYWPNIWAEVTVAHEVQTDRPGVYPYSSFSMLNIPVNNPQKRIQIAFPELPESVQPAQGIPVTIETRDAGDKPLSAEITLAAVDEGIHAILDYQDPDPFAWFQRSRKPDFRRAHYYDQVAYDFEMPAIGGDLIARRLGKDQPGVTENWIKPVALWSGVVRTDESGKAEVMLDLPEFNGQLRLVAVAVTESATGATSAQMFVRRPYILRTSMPRFVLPGDAFQALATVYNMTDQACQARVGWTVSGALQSGAGSQTIDLAPGANAGVRADIAAANLIGQGRLEWSLEVLDGAGQPLEKIEESAPIPVLPPAAYQSRHTFEVLAPGAAKSFQNTVFHEDPRLETTISVSAHPILRMKKALEHVIQYPYGCIEQVTSRCMPMYLLRKNPAVWAMTGIQEEELDAYVRAGIDRLLAMLLPDGGFATWPGAVNAYPYGSVYAAHFLTLVHRDKIIPLPEGSYEAVLEYVRQAATDWSDTNFYTLYLRAYAAYVLALAGDRQGLESIERFDNVRIPSAARYLLAAALAMNTNDPDRVRQYLETAPTEIYNVRGYSGILNSEIRNTAVELMALVQMNGDEMKMQEKALQLARYLEVNQFGTTQENAFIITALGMYLSRASEGFDAAAVTILTPDGEKQISGLEIFRDTRSGPGVVYEVRNNGERPVFVNFGTAGIPLQPELRVVEEGISIQRAFRGDRGEPHDAAAFRHGAVYLVELTIKAPQALENIVVADLLPAGLEIENPRLDADALTGKDTTGAVTPAYLEVRDDRLVLAFDRLEEGEHHFYYAVRAVTPGNFQYPSVTAECMYEPQIRATSLPGATVIE